MHAAQVEVLQYWGDSLLRVERFPRARRVTVGPAGRSDFVAPVETPTTLVEGGVLRGHAGAGETAIALEADTDVLVDVGDHTFRVRAVAPERAVAGGVLAHVDWLFIAFCVVFTVLLMLGIVFAVFCVLVFLLLEKIIALLTALGLQALLAFLPVAPPPAPPQPPVIAATFTPPPAAPAPPPGPFFVKPTPTPPPPPPPAPMLAPIPMGDIPSRKLARLKKNVKPLEDEIAPPVLLESLAISRLEGGKLDADESYGVLAMLSNAPPPEPRPIEGGLGLRGVGVVGRGEGDLVANGAGGLGGLRGSDEDVVDVVAEGVPGGVVGGVVGGVEGGVPGGVVGGVIGGESAGVVGGLGYVDDEDDDAEGYGPGGGGIAVGYGTGGGGKAVGIGQLGSVSRSRPRSQVDEVLREQMDSVQECYKRELDARPDLKERLVLLITIEPSGTVSKVRVASSLQASESLNGCVIERVKALEFPPHDGSVTTTPFIVRFESL